MAVTFNSQDEVDIANEVLRLAGEPEVWCRVCYPCAECSYRRSASNDEFPLSEEDEESDSVHAAQSSQVNLPYSPDILGAQMVQADVYSRRRY